MAFFSYNTGCQFFYIKGRRVVLRITKGGIFHITREVGSRKTKGDTSHI